MITLVFSSRYIVFLCESNFHPSYTKTQSVIWYHLKVLWYLYFLSLKWNTILFIINQRYDYTHINYISYPPKKNKPHICKSINKSSSWTLQNALKHSKARIKLQTCNFTWNFKVALLFETLLITASSGSLWLLNLTSCQSDFHVSVWVDRWEDIFTLISFESIRPIFRSPC